MRIESRAVIGDFEARGAGAVATEGNRDVFRAGMFADVQQCFLQDAEQHGVGTAMPVAQGGVEIERNRKGCMFALGGHIFLDRDREAEIVEHGRVHFVHQGTDVRGQCGDGGAEAAIADAVGALAQRKQMPAHAIVNIGGGAAALFLLGLDQTAGEPLGAVAGNAERTRSRFREVDVFLRPARQHDAQRRRKTQIEEDNQQIAGGGRRTGRRDIEQDRQSRGQHKQAQCLGHAEAEDRRKQREVVEREKHRRKSAGEYAHQRDQ